MSRVSVHPKLRLGAPLVYFYGGSQIPSYSWVTLRYMRSRWDGEIVVLHSSSLPKKVRGVAYLNYTEWYDSRSFDQFKSRSPLDGEFRDGFWFLTAERFFVLAQWAKRAEVHRFLHAELDVALYDTQDLSEKLDEWGEGIFFPRASSEFAGASLLYVNSLPALDALLKFTVEHAELGSEMRILASFNDLYPERAFALPSHASIMSDLGIQKTWKGLEPSDIGGIVDVGALGTWMLGDDPRNVRGRPSFNKAIVDGHGSDLFAKLSFRYSPSRKALLVKAPSSQELKIKALHIHSKEMGLALSPWKLLAITWILRLPWRSPIVLQSIWSEISRTIRAVIDLLYIFFRKIHVLGKLGRN